MLKTILNKEQPETPEIIAKLIFVLLLFLFFQPTLVYADKASCPENGYITKFENGSINWSTGIITAKGKAIPSKEDKNKSSSSIPGAAKTDAMVNLISILKNIKIT